MQFTKKKIQVLKLNTGGNCRSYQSAGNADHSDGSLGRLGDVKQVVEQRLVLVVGKQVELIQDEQHRAAAAAITWCETQKSAVCQTNQTSRTLNLDDSI